MSKFGQFHNFFVQPFGGMIGNQGEMFDVLHHSHEIAGKKLLKHVITFCLFKLQ